MISLETKLGLKPGTTAYTVHAPDDYSLNATKTHRLVAAGELPGNLEWLQVFYSSAQSLLDDIPQLSQKLASTGQLWVCWPKKTAGVKTDLTDRVVREILLATGLVDVKVVAVNKTWSALKFVHRLVNR